MTAKLDPSVTTHAESSFDPVFYVSEFYGDNLLRETKWILDQFHDTFVDGKLKGEQLLDLGSGPVVYPVVTASRWFDKIYLSDFYRSNVKFLQKWRQGEKESVYMKSIMEHFAQKEEDSVSWEALNKRVSEKVKGIVECDVNTPNPISGTVIEEFKFDVITCSLCLQVATLTFESFGKALKNISTLLKPGGHIVIVDVLDQTFYGLGENKFQALCLTMEELQSTIQSSGYTILGINTTTSNVDPTYSNGITMYCVVAKKQS